MAGENKVERMSEKFDDEDWFLSKKMLNIFCFIKILRQKDPVRNINMEVFF